MEIFDDINRNQINIAIIGPISAGKSTLINTIFCESYSHCKIKRTTMTPQVYYESDKQRKKLAKDILKENASINESIIKKTENKELLTYEDIKENTYIVPKIYGFTDLESNIFTTIYDIPGLNDGRTKDLYFKYIDDNFYKFDIVIFVVDINSSLNTSDEVEILVNILTNMKKNKENYNIENKLLVIANKCDEMHIDDSGNLCLYEEHQEMFDQLSKMVEQKINDIYVDLQYEIIPLSSEDSYVYRMYDRNKAVEDFNLDIKYVNKFGYNEYGRTRWNRLNDCKKTEQIKKILKDMDIKESLKVTGFENFAVKLNNFLNIICIKEIFTC